MSTFYVDESGFTGEDLLSSNQPIFAHATNDFGQDEAQEIIAAVFDSVNVKELKYARLQRNARHRERVVELVRTVASDPTRAATWIAHKEFALVTFLVDWWLEPLAYRNGLNLYKDGANLGMANMLFFCLEGFWSRSFRRKLLTLFQRMVRTRNQKAFNQFEKFVRTEKAKVDADRAEILRYIWPSFALLGMEHVRGLPDRVLDVALPGLIFLGHKWRERHDGLWEVVHDQSTNMAKQKWLWDAFSSPDIASARFENPSGAQQFPMNVAGTRFADSVYEQQLQICDVLAGATTAYLRNSHNESEDKQFAESLADAGIDKLIVGGLWPSKEVAPEELGMKGWDGSVAIDWITDQLAGKDVKSS